MKVLLYKVGRNLNRVYRTCEAFGVPEIELLDCNAKLSGNLFRAAGRVRVRNIDDWPPPSGMLALETCYPNSIYTVDWRWVSMIVIGGETQGLPTRSLVAEQKVYIPMIGRVSGLTVEAALAIVLYEWRRWGNTSNK